MYDFEPIVDKYMFSDITNENNNDSIEKILDTIDKLKTENKINWKYYESSKDISKIHYAEYTACSEVDTILHWVEKWVINNKQNGSK